MTQMPKETRSAFDAIAEYLITKHGFPESIREAYERIFDHRVEALIGILVQRFDQVKSDPVEMVEKGFRPPPEADPLSVLFLHAVPLFLYTTRHHPLEHREVGFTVECDFDQGKRVIPFRVVNGKLVPPMNTSN